MSQDEGIAQEEQSVVCELPSHVLTFGFPFFIPVFQTQTQA